jgi:Domain of unknown function (DUF4180)
MPRDAHLNGVRILACDPGKKKIASDRDAIDLVGEACGQGADFFCFRSSAQTRTCSQLKTGLAGAAVQKFVQYALRLAIIGDVSRHVEQSASFRDLVRESNRRSGIWFVADEEEVRERLASAQALRSATP